jgi:hypothetical protein
MGLMHKQLSVTLCHGSDAQTIIGDIMSWVCCHRDFLQNADLIEVRGDCLFC